MSLRKIIRGLFVALLGAFGTFGAFGAERPVSEGQILEQIGRVGNFTLGTSIRSYAAKVRQTGPDLYRSVDGSIELFTDASGNIQQIRVHKPGAFTQRLVSVRESSMREVLERYGKVRQVRKEEGRIHLQYTGFTFSFDNSPGNTVDPIRRPIESITISLALRADNTAKQAYVGRWNWTVFLTGPEEELSRIECVEYTLHPTFPNPVQKVCERGRGLHAFPLIASGWGTFLIKIRVTFRDRDEEIKHLQHYLKF